MADKNPKNIIHVEITDSVGDGGTFYGDHVVVGDPFEDPPANWEHGQLLFDGNEEDPNEAMTTMLAKVKEQGDLIAALTARIEELEGN